MRGRRRQCGEMHVYVRTRGMCCPRGVLVTASRSRSMRAQPPILDAHVFSTAVLKLVGLLIRHAYLLLVEAQRCAYDSQPCAVRCWLANNLFFIMISLLTYRKVHHSRRAPSGPVHTALRHAFSEACFAAASLTRASLISIPNPGPVAHNHLSL